MLWRRTLLHLLLQGLWGPTLLEVVVLELVVEVVVVEVGVVVVR